MPSEPRPSQPNQNPDPPASAERKFAIRTMKTDAEELFKTEKPSLINLAAKTARSFPDASQKRNRPLATIGVALIAFMVLGAGIFFLWRNSASLFSLKTTAETPETKPMRLTPPPPYFATETSRTISAKKKDRAEFVRLMQDAWHEKEREGTIKRIVIKVQDGPYERFATLGDFFELWRITPPQGLIDQVDENLMVFIYYGASGSRLGLAVRTRESERAFADMLRWESSILTQITPLFFDERIGNILAPFEDRTYRNIDWRYLKLSQEKDLGIGYLVFPVRNVFLLTTSKQTLESVINRLFDAR